jgi:phosphate starvation-inducible protein PhoH and related proteins
LSELIIPFNVHDPVAFLGVNESNLDAIRSKFPAIKILARGNEIKVLGNEQQLPAIAYGIQRAIELFSQKGVITKDDLNNLFDKTVDAEEKKTNGNGNGSESGSDVIVYGNNGIVVKARTANQKKMVASISDNDIVFAIGPAGTGKTYTAVALAVRALRNREIRKIILTRPAVEAGENLGFLPGDLKEKIDPYLRPLYDALYDMIPAEKLKLFLETGVIEVAPLAFMRGRTLDNAFVILDEAQNATESQLKMFLTRMGPSAKFIVTGDVTQIDLPAKQPSGLLQAIKILKNIKQIDFIFLDETDVVRHRLVRDIIKAYHKKDDAP